MRTALDYSSYGDWLPALTLLGLGPVVVNLSARAVCPRRQWALVGITAGAVASPFSMGLYGTVLSLPVLGLAIYMMTLTLAMLHAWPGFYSAIALGLVPKGAVVQGAQHLYVDALNALIWGILYGAIGVLVDRRRARAR